MKEKHRDFLNKSAEDNSPIAKYYDRFRKLFSGALLIIAGLSIASIIYKLSIASSCLNIIRWVALGYIILQTSLFFLAWIAAVCSFSAAQFTNYPIKSNVLLFIEVIITIIGMIFLIIFFSYILFTGQINILSP